jgi:predicted phage tail protein
MEAKLFTITMYGFLGKQFGKNPIEIYAKDTKDVFAGLSSRFGDSFKEIILNGAWHITCGKRNTRKLSAEDNFLSEELIDFPLVDNELHIFPAITGAGGKGIGQIILGVVLIIVAIVMIWNPLGWAAAAGAVGAGTTAATIGGVSAASLALAGVLSIAGGVMAMLTKTPTMDSYAGAAGAEQRPSFIFNGAINNTEQGVPVPLVYGRHLTGSTVISAGMEVVQL